MRRAILSVLIVATCPALFASAADAKKEPSATTTTMALPTTTLPPPLIFQQSGSGTARTHVFEVPSDWDLGWVYDCSNFVGGQGSFIVEIYDYYGRRSKLDLDNRAINRFGTMGRGMQHFRSGGNKKFLKVASGCNWTLVTTKSAKA
jgi:hypothetical protein